MLQALAAVALFSPSPVLVRCFGVSAAETTFWRRLTTGTVVTLGALMRRPVRWRALPHRWFAAYGVVIALHYFLYFASLVFTSVAHSLALVYTAPRFIALLSQPVLGERLAARRWLGIAVGVAGAAILAGFEPAMTPRVAVGDALAIGPAGLGRSAVLRINRGKDGHGTLPVVVTG